ncbi:MAG: hypothetical protein ABJA02_16720 [Acidobacteriota bacterium]
MGNTENINALENRLQPLLEAYLQRLSRADLRLDPQAHLDEDALTAFTEGNLTRREADPMVAHLSDCSFCRHKTAELVRLDLDISGAEAVRQLQPDRAPSKVSEVMTGILDRLFGGGESAVFAHEDKKTDEPAHETDESHRTPE